MNPAPFAVEIRHPTKLAEIQQMKKHLPAKQFNEIKKTFQASKQNGFVTAVNARIVHEWLGVKSRYATWITRRIEKYGFVEHVDYCIVYPAKNGKALNSNDFSTKEYHLTPDCIKQLAMVESSEMGKLARLYFLDCEIKAQEKQDQLEYRQTLKVEFKPMTEAIMNAHENPQHYHYSGESDMINRIVIGMSAAKFRATHDIGKSESIRDYMTETQMKAVIDLQRANTVFIQLGEEFKERQEKLTKMFDMRFKDALKLEFMEIEP